MKQKRLVFFGFIVLLILSIAGLYALQAKNSTTNDMLIIWGKYNGECLIWATTSEISKLSSPIKGHDMCNYILSDIGGIDSLVHVQYDPGKVSIYTITKRGRISKKEMINTESLRITSYPQWDQEQFMYLSGIQNDSEQIYRINSDSGEVFQLTHVQTGMAHTPSLSPDGKYLAYLVYTQATNSTECFMRMCGGQYHVMEIAEERDVELNPLVMRSEVPFFAHCLATWSPDSRFLAFSLGCESQSPQELVIFDVPQSQTVVKLGQDDAIGLPTIEGWLTDDELVYSSATDFNLDPVGQLSFPSRRYYVHSLITSQTSELGRFPLMVSANKGGGELFYLENISWAKDGSQLVGIAGPPQKEELIISDLDNDIVRNIYLHNSNPQVRTWHPLRVDPAWSLSGNWIAYSSAEGGVNVVDKTGSIMHKLDIPVMDEYGFAWVQP